jgi:hypothetical protein
MYIVLNIGIINWRGWSSDNALGLYLRMVGLNVGQDTSYPDCGFHDFPQCLQVAARIAPRLGRNHFQIFFGSSLSHLPFDAA